MRLSRFVALGTAVVTVVTSLMAATAAVSVAAPPATVPAAAAPRPVVSKLSLTSGPVGGGVRVTVTGRYFTKVTKVVFGSSAGKSLKVLSGTKLEVTAPGHPAGVVNVRVVAKAGTSKAVTADRFTYIAAPVISKVSPAQGSAKGGTRVTITGSNFIRVTKVTFGGRQAKIGAHSSHGSLSVTAPAGTAGRVDIRVSTAYGTSAAVTADKFTYQALTISPGGTFLGYHATPLYSWVHIAVGGFRPDSTVSYTCTTDSTFFQGPGGAGIAGTTYTTDAAGATVKTDARGSASFDSPYLIGENLGAPSSVTCTSGNVSGTAAFSFLSPWPGGSVSISPGAAAPPGCASPAATCNYVHFVVTNFPANSIVDYGCTGHSDAGAATSDTDSAGAIAVTDASGHASFDASLAFPSASFAPPSGDIEVSCGTDGIWVTYDS